MLNLPPGQLSYADDEIGLGRGPAVGVSAVDQLSVTDREHTDRSFESGVELLTAEVSDDLHPLPRAPGRYG